MQVNFGLLDPNAFERGRQNSLAMFEQGRQMRRERDVDNALRQFAADPDNPQSVNALMAAEPRLGLQVRNQQIQQQQFQQRQQQEAIERNREHIVTGAKIFRQLGVKDEAGYQQALAIARQIGVPDQVLAGVPPSFDPQYVQGMIATADALEPQKDDATALQRDYEFLKQTNPALAEQFLRNKAEGAPLIASNGDGTFTIIPRGMAAPQGSAPPPPPPGFVLDGGPTPPASGTFQP